MVNFSVPDLGPANVAHLLAADRQSLLESHAPPLPLVVKLEKLPFSTDPAAALRVTTKNGRLNIKVRSVC